jgi:hypothetical protein
MQHEPDEGIGRHESAASFHAVNGGCEFRQVQIGRNVPAHSMTDRLRDLLDVVVVRQQDDRYVRQRLRELADVVQHLRIRDARGTDTVDDQVRFSGCAGIVAGVRRRRKGDDAAIARVFLQPVAEALADDGPGVDQND